jgi:hypothetical protein
MHNINYTLTTAYYKNNYLYLSAIKMVQIHEFERRNGKEYIIKNFRTKYMSGLVRHDFG